MSRFVLSTILFSFMAIGLSGCGSEGTTSTIENEDQAKIDEYLKNQAADQAAAYGGEMDKGSK